MSIPQRTEEQLIKAIVEYDKGRGDRDDFTRSKSQKFAIKYKGQLYPPKVIISSATGLNLSEFSGGEVSNRYLKDRGFEIIELTNDQEKNDASNVSDLRIRERIEMLRQFKNLILEGVPGTGKTYSLKLIAELWSKFTGKELVGCGQGAYAMTFHPSTSYEEFVEGLRPQNTSCKSEGGIGSPNFFLEQTDQDKDTNWGVEDGFFIKVCRWAWSDPTRDHLILIDEINRANIPRVFGDLITTIESSKRASWLNDKWSVKSAQVVSLPFSHRSFCVPDNLYIIATMNSTDRSVAPLDAALRRRFAFERVPPMSQRQLERVLSHQELQSSITAWSQLNRLLRAEIGPEGMLGHSYLFDLNHYLEESTQSFKASIHLIWRLSILPQVIDSLTNANRIEHDLVNRINQLVTTFGLSVVITGAHHYYRALAVEVTKHYLNDAVKDTGDSSFKDLLDTYFNDIIERFSQLNSNVNIRTVTRKDRGYGRGHQVFIGKIQNILVALRFYEDRGRICGWHVWYEGGKRAHDRLRAMAFKIAENRSNFSVNYDTRLGYNSAFPGAGFCSFDYTQGPIGAKFELTDELLESLRSLFFDMIQELS